MNMTFNIVCRVKRVGKGLKFIASINSPEHLENESDIRFPISQITPAIYQSLT